MNAYQAVMAGADFIEKNLHRYAFSEIRVPRMDSDDRGCMWAWAGHFYGVRAGDSMSAMVLACAKVNPSIGEATMFNVVDGSNSNPHHAANKMREFAKTYLYKLAPPPAPVDTATGLELSYLKWRKGFLAWAKGVLRLGANAETV